ncbi:MAG: 3-hydroxyacyl-ACP dehydratase FabZ [Campylobacteraceae bacterium]|jgi:3-hydroxyacyl-[acyl-carrier-protein] dehydratase|nr:3-hydroxyacyl-ACP dehydratase FabZ [Campylobacteraceae bacterium]
MLDISDIRKVLPHRYPFLLVDRVTEIQKNIFLKCYKNITINEEIFQGYFQKKSIYPDVLIVEGLAQASGIFIFYSLENEINNIDKEIYLLKIDKAKFRKHVVTGDKLKYKVMLIEKYMNVWKIRGEAFVDNYVVTEVELIVSFKQ